MRNHVRQLRTLGYKVTFEPRRPTTGCTLTRLRRAPPGAAASPLTAPFPDWQSL